MANECCEVVAVERPTHPVRPKSPEVRERRKKDSRILEKSHRKAADRGNAQSAEYAAHHAPIKNKIFYEEPQKKRVAKKEDVLDCRNRVFRHNDRYEREGKEKKPEDFNPTEAEFFGDEMMTPHP